jgi:hypothetical protein
MLRFSAIALRLHMGINQLSEVRRRRGTVSGVWPASVAHECALLPDGPLFK